MDLPEMLRATEAPQALVEWAPARVNEGYETCPSGTWLVWLAGSSGFPLDILLRCVMELLDEAIDELGDDFDGRDLFLDALDVAQDYLDGEATATDCLEVAEECEQLAEEPPASYRDAVMPGFVELGRALAWIPRAADGFESARRQLEAPRLDHAKHMGALIGAGSHVFVPNEQPIAVNPMLLPDDSAQQSLVYVVAALAEAVSFAEQARYVRLGASSAASRQQVAQWAADRLRAIAAPAD